MKTATITLLSLTIGWSLQSADVIYELKGVSIFGHSIIQEDSSIDVIEVPLKGTFKGNLEQTILGVGILITEINFESASGPRYVITGEGGWSVGVNPEKPGGLPGRSASWMTVDINDVQNAGLVNEPGFNSTFPIFALHGQFFPPNSRREFYGIHVTAVPIESEQKRFFRRGDIDSDGRHGMTDALGILSYLFQEGGPLSCDRAADVDDDGTIAVTDAIYLLGFLFQGTGLQPVPSVLCGIDETEDQLTCEETNCDFSLPEIPGQ
jgi:hypothetical protein